MEREETIKRHFEEEAGYYDGLIITLIPYYHQMVDAMISAIPQKTDSVMSVLDLGCGTGTVALNVKKRFPNAKITCLDLAENMLAMAKEKLSGFQDVDYIQADFNTYVLPNNTYDVIVSSLALHHLVSVLEKKGFYAQIFNALKDQGVFFNADVILGSNAQLQAMYMTKWKEFQHKSISWEEIEGRWIPAYEAEDRPARLMDHFAWLDAIGFSDIDVIWKYYNFAVYGGLKNLKT